MMTRSLLATGLLTDFGTARLHAYVSQSNLLHHAYHGFTSHFLLIWLIVLLLVIACGLRFSGYRDSLWASLLPEGGAKQALGNRWRHNLADGISIALLLVFLSSYIFLIFYKEAFVYYDDDMLTDFSLQGKNFPTPIWPDIGRFYPLADQEFNLLKFVTRSSVGYHSLVAAQLVLLVFVLWFALREFKLGYRILVLISAMVAPSFVISFTGFVYPERNVLFWLAIMVLCLQGYSKTRAPIYFIGCLVATHVALYYKETVVLFVVGYALTRLALEVYAEPRGSRRSWRIMAKESSLSLGILAVSAIYVLLFLVAMSSHRSFSYIAEHRETLGSVFKATLQLDWLALILLGVIILRLGRFILSDGSLDPLWDALGAGALAYFIGVIALRLNSGYYMAPVDLIAILYLASMSQVWLSKPTKGRISVVAIVFVVICLHNIAYSSFRLTERKSLIIAKEQLGEFLRNYRGTENGGTIDLFFPYSSGYHLMGFSSYLRYKGFQLYGQNASTSTAGPRFVIKGPQEFFGGRCIEYRDYVCVHADSAKDGSLIIVLPDDDVSASEVENIGKNSILLLSTKACAVIQTDAWFRSLHAISAEFSNRPLPGHWLQLHVFKKTG